ncbi:glycosyltransferase family 4 protein [Candidatus Uhrbacteria bacterium]|nr:glycosyltransferase family 4 protein [Candidatus Uhrbacteria bacterium]
MKKTLLVTLDFYPSIGGVSNYWVSLGQHMPFGQWAVLTPPLASNTEELKSAYRIYRYPFYSSLLWPRWLPLILALLRVILQERPRALIAAQVLPVGTAIFFVSRLFRIPYIVSTHGMDVTLPFSDERKKNLCKKIFSHAKKIIANSTYTAHALTEYGLSESMIDFVYPCPALMPEKEYVPRISTRKEIILLTVGRLVRRKGHAYVLDSLALLKEYHLPIYYIVVGEGPERENLAKKTKELGLQDRVLFTGPLADEAVKQWYKKCDIFIMTPYEINGDVEGLGIVYLEANAFGKPVIATRSGGVGDAVIDGTTGLRIEPEHSHAIRDSILRLIENPEFAKSLGIQGMERVKKEFQWSAQAEKLKNIVSAL